jgi:hypothetical protein
MAPWFSRRAIFYSFVHLKQVKMTLTTQSIIVIWKFNLWEGEDKN